MKLMEAMTINDARTKNGALTHSTTNSNLLDLFFIAGASRNMRDDDIEMMFTRALGEDERLAVQLALWARDCRGGAGERRFFRVVYRYLKRNNPNLVSQFVHKVPELGRWDDLWHSDLLDCELRLIKKELLAGNGLLAKWVPRRSPVFAQLASLMDMNLSSFRRFVVKLSNTVEQKMSVKDYSFEYSHVPSVAMSRYGKAFRKNDGYRFAEYLSKVEKGEAKINASTLFPYDCLRNILADQTSKVGIEQWKALPNYYTDENILVVCDVSGSMGYVGSPQLSPIHVSVSLALYTSERNTGIFKDCFITFSGRPSIQKLSGPINQRITQLSRADWGMNTNLSAVFSQVLVSAVTHKVPESEMPTKLLIISDMEFDSCVSMNNFDNIRTQYANHGYKLPQVVFWNVNGRPGNNPVKVHQSGAALVSGSSPSILKSVLGDLNPMSVMLSTIDVDKYRF